MNTSKIGENIRRERKRLNLTIAQLAERADISDNFMGNIERGRDVPSLGTLISIANALIVDANTLLADDLAVCSDIVSADDVTLIEINRLLSAMTDEQKKYILEQIKSFKKYETETPL